MNQPNTDLFGEAPRISIPNNEMLANLCNHILDLVGRDPSLLDGKTVGNIDRKLMLAIWENNGLLLIVKSGDIERFRGWAMNPKVCVDAEAISRARRYLSEKDFIRLPKTAIEQAERHRQRIARSVKG